MKVKIAIIGGGISGLAVGFELKERGVKLADMVVLEKESRATGNVATSHVNGYTLENGPNGFLDNAPKTLELVRRLGLEHRLLKSNATSAKRFIFRKGRLRQLPTSPLSFFTSSVLPLGDRLRVFLEPLIKKGGYPGESVYDFASRRIGAGAASILIDAMVSGIFAGDARQLELAAAFPKMAQMEATYGGLVKAMLAKKKAAKKKAAAGENSDAKVSANQGPAGPGGHLTSFIDGFQELPDALADSLQTAVQTNSAVLSVCPNLNQNTYTLTLENNQTLQADAVVFACPAHATSLLVDNFNPALGGQLAQIPSSPIAVVATVYKKPDLPAPPDGFGFLVPRAQGPRILGCLWTSSIWNGRCGDEYVLLRTMIGGAHDGEAVQLDDDALSQLTAADLKQTMGLVAKPVFTKINRYKRGIAQYLPGHGGRLAQIKNELNNFPGLFISGSSYHGVSVNHCVAEAPEVAEAVQGYLQHS